MFQQLLQFCFTHFYIMVVYFSSKDRFKAFQYQIWRQIAHGGYCELVHNALVFDIQHSSVLLCIQHYITQR